MNILFITLIGIDDITDRNLYADLMRSFINKGHHVTIYSTLERRQQDIRISIEGDGYKLVRVKTLNIQKSNFIEKVIGTFMMDFLVKRALRKHDIDSKFDLTIYTTPPITLTNTISFVKGKFGSRTYLLLKDIFPQNAVDLEMMKQNSFIHRYFRKKEKTLYQLSDRIGCMSQANVDYLLAHNTEISNSKVEVCPNSIDPIERSPSLEEKLVAKNDLGVDKDSRLFIYGGNLGKPQGINQLISLLDKFVNHEKVVFMIVGSGTEYSKLEKWIAKIEPVNIFLKPNLPKLKYDELLKAADVGMIFLDSRFTIPNFPSRLLSYLENGLPVLICSDKSTDMGKIAETNQFGKYAYSGDTDDMENKVNYFLNLDIIKLNNLGQNARTILEKEYCVSRSVEIISKY